MMISHGTPAKTDIANIPQRRPFMHLVSSSSGSRFAARQGSAHQLARVEWRLLCLSLLSHGTGVCPRLKAPQSGPRAWQLPSLSDISTYHIPLLSFVTHIFDFRDYITGDKYLTSICC